MGRIRHRNLSQSVQGSANKYGTAPTVGRNSFALRLFSIRVVPSKTDARASAAVVAILAWVLKKELLASNGAADDNFGWSVALDGNRALVGAPYRHGPGGILNQGAAYIFDYNGNNWTKTADISLGTDGSSNDFFGRSVALDGSRALVGAPYRDGPGGNDDQGAAYIFDLSSGSWGEPTDISLGTDGGANDFFGHSVALDGNRALVGAYRGGDNSQGAAYIFDLSSGSWGEPTDISLGTDGSSNDYFGISVALDGNRALVGAWGRDGVKTNQGAAYIFDLSSGSWGEPKEISLGTDGSSNDQFGYSVALDGNRALVGATGRDGPGGIPNQGAAYIFDLSSGSWTKTADISLGTDGLAGDDFGHSVALDGNRALVGARNRNDDRGAAYIFEYDGTTWNKTAEISLGTDGIAYDNFGRSVALDGSRALAGASFRDGPGGNNQGAAYIFEYERTN
jgi:hypothetical protein